jgi:predicted transglutaminase-like protease
MCILVALIYVKEKQQHAHGHFVALESVTGIRENFKYSLPSYYCLLTVAEHVIVHVLSTEYLSVLFRYWLRCSPADIFIKKIICYLFLGVYERYRTKTMSLRVR